MSVLHQYQQRWLNDKSRFKIGMFARQTGKTFTTTLEIVKDCLLADAAKTPTRWVILSRGERQAREAVEEGVKFHLKAMKSAFEALSYDFPGEGDLRFKALEVITPGGSRITALPANPDTARGFSANVFLDEFAFHQDSRKIWQAVFPVTSNGWKLRVVSTPNGKGNKFFELISGANDDWSRHIVDIHQAVAEGLPRDVRALRSALGDEDSWLQEYELQFLDEASSWLPYDLIDRVEHPDAGLPGLYKGGSCYIGNDIARRNDLWVAWVLELVGDVLWTREIVTLKNQSFAAQDRALDDLMTRYHVIRLVMDQTGMGEKPVEDARRRYGTSRVEGILMSGPRQLDLATAAKDVFEDRRIRIPAGDPGLRADLHKLKKVTGPTGAPRLVANRDSEGHADRAWAGFMAIGAASTGAHEYGYIPASSGTAFDQRGANRPNHDDDVARAAGARCSFGPGGY